MALESLHEPVENLPEQILEERRAISSLMEELEAAHWYGERASCAKDPELKEILEHNRNEELEHAAMLTEWLRRKIPAFDEELQTYLNTTAPVTQIEDAEEGADQQAAKSDGSSLNIGSMKNGG
ncbi:encapsulin-associated ferritin-like protein [Sedimentisphaera salicampi]|uniref:Ferritin n=1 Tax=Sedimentisphaera salicampi TaxID=1941349 RepID=A0A1W6LPC7_9BACT|nr:encapsulin-associated ferritin-like protein [Sedimentisphaera salicampi]ARN57640.1 hypothetical protein STSP1_02061 [Sedimentisphaera salicampi]OXU14208.1 hypothetical protein SMSP1_01974 [Sedimentisphaera salicampi]